LYLFDTSFAINISELISRLSELALALETEFNDEEVEDVSSDSVYLSSVSLFNDDKSKRLYNSLIYTFKYLIRNKFYISYFLVMYAF